MTDKKKRLCVCGSLYRTDSHRAQRVWALCVLRLHAWLRQLFYSLVGPLDPTQPFSLADPSYPQRPALHLIRAALAKTLSRAPRSPSVLLPANNTYSFPLQARVIYMWKHGVLSPVHWSRGTKQSDWMYVSKTENDLLFILVHFGPNGFFQQMFATIMWKQKQPFALYHDIFPAHHSEMAALVSKAEKCPIVIKYPTAECSLMTQSELKSTGSYLELS